MKIFKITFLVLAVVFTACTADNDDPVNPSAQPNLIIKFKFDETQARLDNLGQPSTIPPGNAAQSPGFARMSANYIEFAPEATTALGSGAIVFEGAESDAGGATAIDFQSAQFAGNNEMFLTVPLSDLSANDYNWVRVSLAYQEGLIDFKAVDGMDYTGTLASFVGYNNYITEFDLNGSTITVNDDVLQGFWAFEALGFTSQGQAPTGATTVPNPLFATSPIPQGSCVVTGEFAAPFTITGNETEDIEVVLSFSINNSFEWTEVNVDGKYEPTAGELVADMGLRGLIPSVTN